MCHTVYAEVYPRDCAGCGRPYLRTLVHIGHVTTPRHARALTCERPGCGHVWVMPEEQGLEPVLRRCADRRCPRRSDAEPVRQPFPEG